MNVFKDIQGASLQEQIYSMYETGQLYERLVKKGMRAAIIGPDTLLADPVALELCYCVGPQGIVYSIDPQGEGQGESSPDDVIVGAGNSTYYEKQLSVLRNKGVPLGSFQWLGHRSSLVNIPAPAENLDIIADHGTTEFISLAVDPDYLKRGFQEISSALRVGGVYILQGSSEKNFDQYLGEPIIQVLKKVGLGLVAQHTFSQDIYRLSVGHHVLEQLKNDSDLVGSRKKLLEILLRQASNDELIIPPTEIAYPKRWMLVTQKFIN